MSEKAIVTEWPADAFSRTQARKGLYIAFFVVQVGEPSHTLPDGRERRDAILLVTEVRRRARPARDVSVSIRFLGLISCGPRRHRFFGQIEESCPAIRTGSVS
jgi:hypothetical protein